MIFKLNCFFVAALCLIFNSSFSQVIIDKGKSPLRYEKQMNQFDSLNSIEKSTENSILFIGSSYIRKWYTIKEDLEYDNVFNRGFGGSNMSDVAYYIKRIAYPHQPKAIFIYVGNDITATENDKEPYQVLDLYKYVVKTLREKFISIPIVWLAILPSIKRWTVWDKISQTNDIIKAYSASQSNLFYIDAGANFLNKDGTPDPKYYVEDKLHFNNVGYKLWGTKIKNEVKRIAGVK